MKDSPGATAWGTYAVTMDLDKIFTYFIKSDSEKKTDLETHLKTMKTERTQEAPARMDGKKVKMIKDTLPQKSLSTPSGGRRRRRRKRRTRRGGKSRRKRRRTRRRRRRR